MHFDEERPSLVILKHGPVEWPAISRKSESRARWAHAFHRAPSLEGELPKARTGSKKGAEQNLLPIWGMSISFFRRHMSSDKLYIASHVAWMSYGKRDGSVIIWKKVVSFSGKLQATEDLHLSCDVWWNCCRSGLLQQTACFWVCSPCWFTWAKRALPTATTHSVSMCWQKQSRLLWQQLCFWLLFVFPPKDAVWQT